MSKIDCNITENFLKEWNRMCDIYHTRCSACLMSSQHNEHEVSCTYLAKLHPTEAIAIVQKWSDEHPAKTIKEDFLEKYPNAECLQYGGGLKVCAKWLGYFNKDYSCPSDGDCDHCWNTPLSEVQK